MGGFSLGTVTNLIKKGETDAADAVTSGMEAVGHEASGIARGLVGAAQRAGAAGKRFFGGIARNPMNPFASPSDQPGPHPADYPIDGAQMNPCDANAEGQPFSLNGFINLAAGAQTQGADLVDFHATTSNPTVISTSDLIPGNVSIKEMSLFISARATVTLGFEGVSFLSSGWIIEYINGIEKARWSIKKLSCMVGYTGSLGTAFGQSTQTPLNLPAIPWPRKYDPNVKAKTTYQISVTTTTVNSLDFSMVEEGYRP